MIKRLVAALVLASIAATMGAAEDPRELLRQATAAYQKKDFAASADLFAKAIAAGADGATTLYNAACAAALAGRPDAAFDLLDRAFAAGMVNIDQLRRDPDFESLRALPRWTALLAKFENAKAKAERMWNSPAMATPYKETLTVDERVAGLSRIWSEAKFNFVHFDDVPQLDWDALYLSYLARAREPQSTFEYYKLLMEFMAHLKDGHTGVNPPRELSAQFYGEPAFRLQSVGDGRLVVTQVYDDALAVARGAEVMAVGGVPVREYAKQNVVPYLSASTPQDLEARIARRLLWGPAGSSIDVTFVDASGRQVVRTVRRLTAEEEAKVVPAAPPFEFRMIGRVAYVALNEFGDNKAAEAYEQHFDEIVKADALILDIRRNGGGNSGVGYRVLSTLVDKPFRASAWSTRDYRPTLRAWGRPEGTYAEPAREVPPSETRHFDKPVAMLIGPATYSAAEDLAVAFDGTNRGPLVGLATGGSTGQPLSFSLPGGGSARVCTKHDTYADGRDFVGVGVQPDIEVATSVEAVRAGRDPQLDAAVRLLTKR